MATPIYYPPSVNNLQKEINADYTAGASTVTLNNTTNIQNKPGVCVVNRVNRAGTRQVVSKWTYLKFTGTSGSTLTGVTAISGDQDHAIGEVVEFVPDVTWSEQVAGGFATLLDATDVSKVNTTNVITPDGTQTLTNKTLTSPTVNTPTINGTITLDTDAQTSITNLGASSMSRQAIMNGNFDVWQRGTTGTPADVTAVYTADRWRDYIDKNGGTLPTLSRTRQILTSGDIPNAFYYTRLTTNGAGTSLGASSVHMMNHRVEHGTRMLCGAGKKLTLSFWARSDIANKRIATEILQNYGSTGSPTSTEILLGGPITLTSTWTKYTVTFTTNTLVGKTFGTDNNDYLDLKFMYVWGTTCGNTNVQASVTAETYGGAGTIDIAQVQLCAGDVALPFQPKSYNQELMDCSRYCVVFNSQGLAYGRAGQGQCSSTTSAYIMHKTPIEMRTTPTSVASGNWYLTKADGTAQAVTNNAISAISTGQAPMAVITVAGNLTAGHATQLVANNDTTARIVLDAEL